MKERPKTTEPGPNDAEQNPTLERFRVRMAILVTSAAALFGPEPVIRTLVGCALGAAVNGLGLPAAKALVGRMLGELLGDDATHWTKTGRA